MALDPTASLFIDAITPYLVNAFIGVATAVIAAIGFEARKFAKSNANNENLDFLVKVSEIAVQAAEQVYDAGDGTAKKDFAVDFAQKWLASRGVKVELTQLEVAVEAAVLREFNYPEAVSPADPPTETTVEMTPSPWGNAGVGE